jgi:Domain of unknown function (DUF4260)
VRASLPAAFLRLEGLVVFVAAVALYFDGDYAEWAFLVFLLTPDLSFAGYLAGPRVGAVAYNLAHTYAFPVAIGAGCLLAGETGWPLQAALIWTAHIGIDRVLGYGLKYPTGFKDTHLGRI